MEYKPASIAIYTELIQKIEFTSKWCYLILADAGTAGSVLPLLLLTIVNYFIFELGDDSFMLPWPMLCVRFQINYTSS